MGCNCGGGKTRPEVYKHTASDGTVTEYKTQTEAEAAKVRRGGSYVKVN